MWVWATILVACISAEADPDAWTELDLDDVGDADTALGWWGEPTLVGWQPHVVVEPAPVEGDPHAELWPFLGVARPSAAICAPSVDACVWEHGPFRVRWETVPHVDPTWRETEVVPLVSIDDGPWRMPGTVEDWAFMAYPTITYDAVPYEGCVTARLGAYSGGAHCCDTTWLLTSCPEGASVTRVEGGDLQGEWGAGFADLDEDGTFELVQGDVEYGSSSPIHDVSCIRAPWFGHGPVVWRNLSWSPAGWSTNGPDGSFGGFYARVIDWVDANDVRETEDMYTMSEQSAEAAVAIGAHAYLGGADEADLQRALVASLATSMGAEDVVFDDEDPAEIAALVHDPAALEARRDDLMLDCVHVAPELAEALAADAAAFGPARVATLYTREDDSDEGWPWP
jgi:hypothetical protein